MRESDDIRFVTMKPRPDLAPDDIGERRPFRKKRGPQNLGDRDFSDGQNQIRPQGRDLGLEMRSAIFDFLRRGLAITRPALRFTGKTSRDGRKINPLAQFLLGKLRHGAEPFEQSFPRGVRERTTARGLMNARRLPHQKNFRFDRGTVHGGSANLRAFAAALHFLVNRAEFSNRAHRFIFAAGSNGVER